jgi:UDP-N-acetylglucosamine transferase subunit ALG13
MTDSTGEPACRVRVLTVVGTDYHPFPRLVRAMDEWGKEHPEVDCFVQFGTTDAPIHSECAAYLEHELLTSRMGTADVVVSHGGPSTIVETRRRGIRPIVMPRRERYDEQVDDHQVRFTRRLAAADKVTMVDEPLDLVELLERVLADLSMVRLTAVDEGSNAAAVSRFGDLVSGLFVGGGSAARVRRRR